VPLGRAENRGAAGVSGELLFLINVPNQENRYLTILDVQMRSARARIGRGNSDCAAMADRTAVRT
jgi:hypothetical protein